MRAITSVVVLLGLAPWSLAQPGAARAIDLSHEHVPGELIYAPQGAATLSKREAIKQMVGAIEEQALWPGKIYRLVLPATADLRGALETLNRSAEVRYAEPNYLRRIDQTPNDPSFGSQWGFQQANDADIDAPEAWDLRTDATPVIVGVIDTGIEYSHVDLAGNMWVNPGEIAGNGVDDDGNGWVDDVHGIDTVNGDGNPIDDHGHGTHTAGTVGADTNNGIGVAGTCWTVRLMALKFLSASGSGSTANAILCVNYAVSKGASCTNNSWGGGGFSQGLYDAINLAGNAGQLFCAAAGNNGSNNDASPFYPATYDLPEIISVAATDANDNRASFSNYGATTVDLGAPGVGILSTWTGNSYASLSGTSMATPHVCGVAAMLYAESGSNDPVQVKQWLMSGVDVIPSMTGVTVSNGRLNFRRSLEQVGPPVNDPPVANAGSDQNAFTGQSVTLNGSGSTDPDGDALSFTWDFGDGSPTASGSVVTHAYAAAGTYVATLTVSDGALSDDDTATINVTDAPTTPPVYLSFTSSVTLPGIGTVNDEDIVAYDMLTGAWAMVFDGSDVGITTDVLDFEVTADGSILMCFENPITIPGLIGGPGGSTSVDDSDIVRFVPTSLGANTSGTFAFYFDGSDVGLSTSSEALDGIGIAGDGRLVLSTRGSFSATGASGNDEDLIVFTATSLGATTSGSFAMLFDGSDVSLTSTSENVDAVYCSPDGKLVISTEGNFSVPGLSGADEDLILFTPTSLGTSTSGSFTMFLDGSTIGLSAADVDGVDIGN